MADTETLPNPPLFDIATLREHSVISVIGRRGAGKTTLIADLLLMLEGRAPEATVVRIEGYDRIAAVAQCDAVIHAQSRENHPQHVILLIAESIMASRTVMRDQSFRNLLLNSRRFYTTVIFCTQSLDLCLPIRSNVDYVMVFGNHNVDYRRRLYQYHFNSFQDQAYFDACFDNVTDTAFACLVRDNTRPCNSVSDSVSWYKVGLLGG